MITILYHYITRPIHTIRYHNAISIGQTGMIAIGLASLVQLSTLYPRNIPEVALGIIYNTISIGAFLLILSVVWDFAAQIYRRQGNSVRLFKWLLMTYLPVALLLPGRLLVAKSKHPGSILFNDLLSLTVAIIIATLMIATIKEIYQLSIGKSMVVFILPFILIGCILGLFIAIGSMMAISQLPI